MLIHLTLEFLVLHLGALAEDNNNRLGAKEKFMKLGESWFQYKENVLLHFSNLVEVSPQSWVPSTYCPACFPLLTAFFQAKKIGSLIPRSMINGCIYVIGHHHRSSGTENPFDDPVVERIVEEAHCNCPQNLRYEDYSTDELPKWNAFIVCATGHFQEVLPR